MKLSTLDSYQHCVVLFLSCSLFTVILLHLSNDLVRNSLRTSTCYTMVFLDAALDRLPLTHMAGLNWPSLNSREPYMAHVRLSVGGIDSSSLSHHRLFLNASLPQLQESCAKIGALLQHWRYTLPFEPPCALESYFLCAILASSCRGIHAWWRTVDRVAGFLSAI